ncbi:hypothetical protein BXZ70DRAFT_537025 [Cristinia sonorae]|uniref:Uncharacterized protein n=1 Tax=Cristinia sonorae TaxID=1940300 RepID=A0A8K0XLA9_9AGAR|nr:hypothetical protein BXZ70DRAFT_537025 [Cristinia sonorae]
MLTVLKRARVHDVSGPQVYLIVWSVNTVAAAQESISQVFGRIPQDHRNLLTEQASISDPLLGADNTGHTTHIESQSPREHVHHTHSATDDRPRNLRLPESDLRMITDLEISADRVVPPYPTEDSDPMPMEYMEQSVKVLRNIAIDHNDEWERLRVASEQAKAAMLSAENARRALMQERYMRERLEVQMAYSNNYTPEWPDRAIYRGTTEAKEYTTGFSEFSDYSEDSEDDGGEP